MAIRDPPVSTEPGSAATSSHPVRGWGESCSVGINHVCVHTVPVIPRLRTCGVSYAAVDVNIGRACNVARTSLRLTDWK